MKLSQLIEILQKEVKDSEDCDVTIRIGTVERQIKKFGVGYTMSGDEYIVIEG